MLSLGSGNSCVYRLGFFIECVCVCLCVLGWGSYERGWHPTHKNVSAQVMAGAYDQIFSSFYFIYFFFNTSVPLRRTHADTRPSQHLPLDP